KKGDLMAAVELEDLGGSVEVIVFPRTYQQHRDLLKEDAVVLVQGKVDTRDDQPKLLCESVEAFEPSAEQIAAATEAAAAHLEIADAQTAYPLDSVEAEAAGLDAGSPEPPPQPATQSDAAAWPVADAPTVEETAEVPAGIADSFESWSDPAPATPTNGTNGAPVGEPHEPQLLLELTMERSAREERDVNRLVRLDHLLGQYPGHDRVVLRFLLGGREGPAIELAERVRCCAALVEEVVGEFG